MPNDKTYFHSWEVDNPKANIILIHGLGEHIHRYEEWASYFNSLGYGVFGFDHSGHGQSPGKRGHLACYDDSYDVVDGLLDKLGSATPTFLYGHSFGGNMVLNYVLDRKPQVTGVVASAPFITAGSPIPKLLVLIGKLMSRIYPSLQLDNGLDVTNLSTDSNIIERYQADPLVHSKVSARLGALMMRFADRLVAFSGSFPASLLMMHGEKDIITNPNGSEAFASRVTSPMTMQIWKDEFHEIHNGQSKKKVWDFTSNWMDSQI